MTSLSKNTNTTSTNRRRGQNNLNSAGEIYINIELQDLFTYPAESYIVFDGRLTKTDGTAYANADAVALTNNGLMYLFSNISYRLSSQEIESVHHPGQATTMLGLLKYSDDFWPQSTVEKGHGYYCGCSR